MGRRFWRHFDEDLIDRMAAGWTPKARKAEPKKKAARPRPFWTYRAFRRNVERNRPAFAP